MSTKLAHIQLKLDTLPNSPGVYIFKNDAEEIIYIGKALNLRHRVRSYFQTRGTADPKTHRMLAQVADVELMSTANEVEALILEANLIREHKPHYNIDLKDDKHFPYIKVTTNEPFPRVLVVRRLAKDGATYFGPYTSAKSMRRTIALLTQLFTIRSCNLVIPHPTGKKYKVCLDYHIKRCKGPCEDLQSQADYGEQVDSLLLALSGKSQQLIERLTKKMTDASDAQQYEEAAVIRDQIDAIQKVMRKQHVDVNELVDRDVVAIAREGKDAIAVVMQIRDGAMIGRQEFQLTSQPENFDDEIMEAFVTQYYHHQPNLPNEILLASDLSNFAIVADWLKQIQGGRITIATPLRGDKVRLVELAKRNARLLLDDLLIQKRQFSERTSKMVTALKDALKLPHSPMRIVCFDISNTGETDAVGSCVFFENAKPKKSQYRHFKIKGVTGQDDYKMMREIVGRYFHRVKTEGEVPPDLVVIDGGKGQLSAVGKELAFLGFEDQPVLGLAKRLEEVFLPNHAEPITISKSSPALILLKQLRDEAHRFAITYNRKVRTKRTVTSVLDTIPGVGPAKRKLLLKTFGSVTAIKNATANELSQLKGFSEALAEKILSALNQPTKVT